MRNKILYIHGLSSSGSSSTTRNLQALLPDYSVLSPDLPVAPQEALDMLWHLCELEQPQLIIGPPWEVCLPSNLEDIKRS